MPEYDKEHALEIGDEWMDDALKQIQRHEDLYMVDLHLRAQAACGLEGAELILFSTRISKLCHAVRLKFRKIPSEAKCRELLTTLILDLKKEVDRAKGIGA